MNKPTLLILAAGMGSRYGGLKQLDPVGPSGEIVLDYSIYDALRAGFGRVVFVIRREMEAAFREQVGAKWEPCVPCVYEMCIRDSAGPARCHLFCQRNRLHVVSDATGAAKSDGPLRRAREIGNEVMSMKTTTSKWFTGIIGALVVLGILIAVNLLFSGVRLRKDLTEEKQYTLSEGTATMLQELQRPVTLKFYVSKSNPNLPMPLKNYVQRVIDFMRELADRSGGNVIFETWDPQPDSDAEELSLIHI